LDAEVAIEMATKRDPLLEKQMLRWVYDMLDKRFPWRAPDMMATLSNGLLLCQLLQRIKPTLMHKPPSEKDHGLVHLENVQLYLIGKYSLCVV
jgi:hypothetical protein